MGNDFTAAAEDSKVFIQASYIEEHNGIGIGERYHHPLHRVFTTVHEGSRSMPGTVALRLAVKFLNATMEPRGLVPSLLVFGTLLPSTEK